MHKHSDLKNKVAIITGAAGYLAEQIIIELAKNKVIIFGLDKDIKNLKSKIEKIKSQLFNKNIFPIKCDVTNEREVATKIKFIVKKYNKIDILINNAATKTKNLKNFFKKFEEFKFTDWKEIMSVNLDSAFLISKEVSKVMMKNRQGSIISLASIQGVVGNDKRLYAGSKFKGTQMSSPAVYSTSKAALIGFSKYLATYLGEHNIRVNTVSPGGIEGGQNKRFIKNYSKKVPIGRMGTSSEVADVILFLCSKDSNYITGQNIIIDGGYTSW